MANPTVPTVSAEEMSATARRFCTFTIVGTLAFLKQHGMSGDAWIQFLGGVGRPSAPDWTPFHADMRQAAETAGMILVGCGATLRSIAGDSTQATATLEAWPSPEDMAQFALTEEDVNVCLNLFNHVTSVAGIAYSWHRRGDTVELRFVATE